MNFRWTFESSLHSFEQDPSIKTRPVEHYGELRVPVSILLVVLNLPKQS